MNDEQLIALIAAIIYAADPSDQSLTVKDAVRSARLIAEQTYRTSP